MSTNTKSINNTCLSAVAAVFTFAAVTAIAQRSPPVKEDQAQMKSDNATLQRQEKRLVGTGMTKGVDLAYRDR